MPFELSRADRDMMHGVIDMHLHAHPCLYERPFNEIECAEQARAAGYRGLVLKSIFAPNADRIELVRKIVPGIELFGSLVLNNSVGGLNPEALRASIGFGVKVVWLPTIHAANHVRYFGVPTYPWQTKRGNELAQTKAPPIALLDADGNLKAEVVEIIALCHQSDLVLGTGHIALPEVMAVLAEAKRIGYRKMVVTHVGWHATDWPIDAIKEMLPYGCTFEFTINPQMPNRQQASPKDFAARIRAVGVENCVVSTDLGQHDTAHPIEGFRMWLRMLLVQGFSLDDIDVMARRNPARLLDLPAAA